MTHRPDSHGPAPDEAPCPILDAIEVFGGRWKGQILWWLRDEPRRFGELRRLVTGVSPKVLTQHLRQLARDGLVHREQHAEIPPRVVYSLTALGASVLPVLDEIADWWRTHHATVTLAREVADAEPDAGAE